MRMYTWERGLNENTNGLVRQYAPKNKTFEHVDDTLIDKVAHKLNHRPRKSLGFKTAGLKLSSLKIFLH